jgi:cobalamin biosynthesis protein CbiD
MCYLERALERRYSCWFAALAALRKAGDDKRIDYLTGIHIFAHFCLEKNPTPALIELLGTGWMLEAS